MVNLNAGQLHRLSRQVQVVQGLGRVPGNVSAQRPQRLDSLLILCTPVFENIQYIIHLFVLQKFLFIIYKLKQ